jgi:hypothetical protein
VRLLTLTFNDDLQVWIWKKETIRQYDTVPVQQQAVPHFSRGLVDLTTDECEQVYPNTSETYRSPEVKSFVLNRTKFNEDCFGTWKVKTNVSDTHLCPRVTFLKMFNEIGQVVMWLRNDIKGHNRISTWHPVGSNWVDRVPHISRMWDEIIYDLFQDIKVELDTPHDGC